MFLFICFFLIVVVSCIWSVVSMLCHVGGGEEGSARHDVMSRLAVGCHGRNGMVFWLQVYDKQIVRLRFGSLQCLVRLFWGELECICYRNLCHS
jgi:hypothetical protein